MPSGCASQVRIAPDSAPDRTLVRGLARDPNELSHEQVRHVTIHWVGPDWPASNPAHKHSACTHSQVRVFIGWTQAKTVLSCQYGPESNTCMITHPTSLTLSYIPIPTSKSQKSKNIIIFQNLCPLSLPPPAMPASTLQHTSSPPGSEEVARQHRNLQNLQVSRILHL